MTDRMDAFYSCIQKTLVEDILNEDGEYLVRTSRQDAEVKRLFGVLDRDTVPLVDNLLTEQLAIGELREGAYFRAGFRLALELTR